MAGILYLIVAYHLSVDELSDPSRSTSKRIRNRAYDYMDQYPYDEYYAGKNGSGPMGTYPQAQASGHPRGAPGYGYPAAGYVENTGYDYNAYRY